MEDLFTSLTFARHPLAQAMKMRTCNQHPYELVIRRKHALRLLQETITQLDNEMDTHTYTVLSARAIEYNAEIHYYDSKLWDATLYQVCRARRHQLPTPSSDKKTD